MPQFNLVEFNTRRLQRGAEAARVEVFWEDGGIELLWMSKRDIDKNISKFGPNGHLCLARDLYSGRAVLAPDAR
jgi:hypothetical protein